MFAEENDQELDLILVVNVIEVPKEEAGLLIIDAQSKEDLWLERKVQQRRILIMSTHSEKKTD